MDKKCAKVSIIVPVYNVENYLARCLDSLISQTLKEIEIICIEDMSTDHSASILRHYEKKDNRIKTVYNTKNKGLSTCRNIGMKLAEAPYIMFLDSDDQYLPDMCYEMYHALEENNSDIAVCNIHILYETINMSSFKMDNDYFSNHGLSGTYAVTGEIINKVTNIVAWNKIYKRSILEKYHIRFPDGLIYESYPFWGEYISVADKITFLDKKLYIYTRRERSIMSLTLNKTNDRVMDYIKSCFYFYAWLIKNNLWAKKQWHFWQMFAFCTSAALSYMPQDDVIYKNIYQVTDRFLKNKSPALLGFNCRRCIELIRKHQLKERSPQIYVQLFHKPLVTGTHSISLTVFYFVKIPVLSIKYSPIQSKYRLFGKINVFQINMKGTKTKYSVFKIPVIKIIKKEKYRQVKMFGFLPILKLFDNKQDFYYRLCQKSLFFLPIKKRLKQNFINNLLRRKVKFTFNSKNFMPFQTDNTVLLKELKKLKNITYIPNPGNLGDCLIAKATYDFFAQNNISYQLYKGGQPETIVYGGGGIWVKDLYLKSFSKILKLMQKAQKIVILPSSVYDCPFLVNILDQRFVVFCREKQTFDYLTAQKTGAKIILDHDMAFRMTAQTFQTPLTVTPEQKLLLAKMYPVLKRINSKVQFLRKDVEKSNSYESHYDLSSAFGSRKMPYQDVCFATTLMLAAVDLFNTVITDRLHVGIAAALMGKEVYLLDNSYKKVSGVYARSLSQYGNIHLCDKFPLKVNSANNKTDNFYQLVRSVNHV